MEADGVVAAVVVDDSSSASLVALAVDTDRSPLPLVLFLDFLSDLSLLRWVLPLVPPLLLVPLPTLPLLLVTLSVTFFSDRLVADRSRSLWLDRCASGMREGYPPITNRRRAGGIFSCNNRANKKKKKKKKTSAQPFAPSFPPATSEPRPHQSRRTPR